MKKRGQNEGSIYHRNDGRWVAVLNLGYRGGKRARKSLYGKTRTEVHKKLVNAMRDYQHGLSPTGERLTLEQFVTQWLDDAVSTTVRPSTLRSYEQLSRLHIIPGLGHICLTVVIHLHWTPGYPASFPPHSGS
jgi:hypothetical protein